MPQSLYQWVWIFLIYAFLGWCVEEVFHAVRMGKFVNRGFLNGPWCPIYGIGMILVILFLYPLRSNLIVLFLGSTVLLTLLEFITGFVLNHVFHSRWWDYSDKPFQLGGYICLPFSLMWGVAGTFVIEVLQDLIFELVKFFPHFPGLILESVILAAFITDCGLTLFTVLKLTGKIHALDELSKGLRRISDDIGETLFEDTESIAGVVSSGEEVFKEDAKEKKAEHTQRHKERRQRMEDALQDWKNEHAEESERLHRHYRTASSKPVFGERRLMKAFPNVKFTEGNDMLQQYKEHLTKQKGENGKSAESSTKE